MLSVGLTGGIASGKTVVRRRLEEGGVATLDADAVVHALFLAGGELARELEALMGKEVIASDGSVNRKSVGKIVFADPEAKKKLESLVHPRVYAAIDDFLGASRSAGIELVVVDAALMIETGSFRRYDVVVVVHCRPEQQRDRLMARDGLTRSEADKRIASQMPVEEKMSYGDFLIDSSGSLAETIARTDEVLAALKERARA